MSLLELMESETILTPPSSGLFFFLSEPNIPEVPDYEKIINTLSTCPDFSSKHNNDINSNFETTTTTTHFERINAPLNCRPTGVNVPISDSMTRSKL